MIEIQTQHLLGANVPFMAINEHWFHQLFNVCHQTRLNFIKETSSQRNHQRNHKTSKELVDSFSFALSHFLMNLGCENDVIGK